MELSHLMTGSVVIINNSSQQDFIITNPRADMDQAVPSSCPTESADSTGCVEVFSSWLTANFLLVSLVSAGLMALQVLGVCLACCLARAVQVQHFAI